MFIVSGFMHTVFAKKTAANIGWQTNGFQYEIGFGSFGMGIAGFVAAGTDQTVAWVCVSIAVMGAAVRDGCGLSRFARSRGRFRRG